MLSQLTIRNYALIDEVNISLDFALNIITGETGAGKSILLGALGLLTGNRADFSVLKDKNNKCIVEAEFQIKELELQNGFEEQDIDYDDLTIIRREILPSGKSRAFVNDTPANLNQLKWLGEQLIDIHAQQQTQQLNNASFQLNVLDAFAQSKKELQEYQQLFKQFTKSKHALTTLLDKQKEGKANQEYLTFQYEELEKVKLDEVDFEELVEQVNTLEHAEELASLLGKAATVLSEQEINAGTFIAESGKALNKAAEISTKFKELAVRLSELHVELNDISGEINVALSETDINPNELLTLKAKLDAIQHLQQKHGLDSLEQLLAFKNNIQQQLLEGEDIEDLIRENQKKLDAIETALKKAGKLLSEKRKSAAPKLAEEVKKYLHVLGMEQADMHIEVLSSDQALPGGLDNIQMNFAANKGVAMQPISKVASGGELSRVMLTLKAILAKQETLPTIIFDEIDTGVSGEVAFKMGKLLKKMGERMQVISITHLPQIASAGHKHFKVIKNHAQEVSASEIVVLSNEERVQELAGMLSGNKVTEHALNNAKELLKAIE